SQHDNQSWVAALTTILDTCALVIARIDHPSSSAARLTFAMARHAVVDLCAVARIDPIRTGIDRLPAAQEEEFERFLAMGGIQLRTDEASIANLRTLRASYEPYVQALSNLLLMPLPRWIPPDGEHYWHTMN